MQSSKYHSHCTEDFDASMHDLCIIRWQSLDLKDTSWHKSGDMLWPRRYGFSREGVRRKTGLELPSKGLIAHGMQASSTLRLSYRIQAQVDNSASNLEPRKQGRTVKFEISIADMPFKAQSRDDTSPRWVRKENGATYLAFCLFLGTKHPNKAPKADFMVLLFAQLLLDLCTQRLRCGYVAELSRVCQRSAVLDTRTTAQETCTTCMWTLQELCRTTFLDMSYNFAVTSTCMSYKFPERPELHSVDTPYSTQQHIRIAISEYRDQEEAERTEVPWSQLWMLCSGVLSPGTSKMRGKSLHFLSGLISERCRLGIEPEMANRRLNFRIWMFDLVSEVQVCSLNFQPERPSCVPITMCFKLVLNVQWVLCLAAQALSPL